MFVLTTTPVWAKALMVVGLALGLLGAAMISVPLSSEKKGFAKVVAIVLGVAVTIVSIVVGSVGSSHVRSEEETFNNPNAVNEDKHPKLYTDVDKIEKEIAEALDADKVQINEEGNNGMYKSKNILNGDMVDFTAVDEGTVSKGYFYFTDSTLEILTTGETDLVDHVSVPAK